MGSLRVQAARGSVGRQEAGTKRGMNVAKLQCDGQSMQRICANLGRWLGGRADGQRARRRKWKGDDALFVLIRHRARWNPYLSV
jgi:hypothetical protein